MNIVTLILSFLVSNAPVGEEAAAHQGFGEYRCVTADKVIRPILPWKELTTELITKNKQSRLIMSLHNPLNKIKDAVDITVVLEVDPSAPKDPSKYNLIMATYFNPNNVVVFRRIYVLSEVKVGKHMQKFPIQTPCFNKEVQEIMQFEPIVLKPSKKIKDGK